MKISGPRKNIIVASIGVLLAALTLVSCEKRDDYYGRGDNGYSETIGFRVVDPMTQTRNHRGLAKVDNEAIDYKTVLRSDNASDSLHLTTYVGDMNSQQYLMTRASAFTTTNLANFVVYGYNSKSEPFSFSDNFIAGSEAIKQTNGTWRFSPDVVWPSGKSDFFAVANIDNNTGVTISTANNVTPSLTYVVPEFATPLDDQGTNFRYNHKDVVVARSGIQEANTGLVPLNFQHVFTAVQFKFGEIKKAGQIHSISIEGIHLNGTLNLAYESASGFMAMNAWSYNDNGTATFSLPLGDNKNITGGEGENGNDGDAIGTLENTFALMMIPQTLEGAKLIIEYTPEGSTTRVNMKASLIGTWAAGKVVTYTISIAEILDIWFNNTTEICLDAHYVMSDQLSVHIGNDVSRWNVESNASWLTVKRDLTPLQEQGWWIIEDKGSVTFSNNQTDKGDFNIWLIAEENNSKENRVAEIRLYSGDDSKIFKITQMCPHWNDAETLGSERIEEYPQRVPWGPFWHSSTENYTITYTGSTGLGDIIALLWHAIAGEGNVEVDVVFLGADKYTFNYKNIKDSFLENTSSTTSGLQNTIGGYSNAIIGTTSFKDFLFSINSNNQNVKPNFTEFIPTESAFVNVLKKNKFHKGTKKDAGQTIEFADIDRAKTEETIVWYLPAKDEVMNGIYEENEKLHSCETPFDPFFDNDPSNDAWGTVFWTSTSVEGTSNQAWTYYFDENKTVGAPKDEGKEENNETGYRVRAVRRK